MAKLELQKINSGILCNILLPFCLLLLICMVEIFIQNTKHTESSGLFSYLAAVYMNVSQVNEWFMSNPKLILKNLSSFRLPFVFLIFIFLYVLCQYHYWSLLDVLEPMSVKILISCSKQQYLKSITLLQTQQLFNCNFFHEGSYLHLKWFKNNDWLDLDFSTRHERCNTYYLVCICNKDKRMAHHYISLLQESF